MRVGEAVGNQEGALLYPLSGYKMLKVAGDRKKPLSLDIECSTSGEQNSLPPHTGLSLIELGS